MAARDREAALSGKGAQEGITAEITDWDWSVFGRLTSLGLDEEQRDYITRPPRVVDRPDPVLAVHWHPEMVPLELVERRLAAMYPLAQESLVIPTQHNELMHYGGFAGAEVDCRAAAFHRKVQLLLHFRSDRVARAQSLRTMITHTRRYRQTQLFEFLDTLAEARQGDRLVEAGRCTGTDEALIGLIRLLAWKLRHMITVKAGEIPHLSLKNKLVSNYVQAHRRWLEAPIIARALLLLGKVKQEVKSRFRLDYFYEVNEVIEETRALGGGIIVPHPEQFWPILLADYDVDGYEVWNPQSMEFTEFLIQAVIKKNRGGGVRQRLLVMMGDDTHLGEKILPPEQQHPEKGSREVGYQPPWEDAVIARSLAQGDFDKRRVIQEYRFRLGGTV